MKDPSVGARLRRRLAGGVRPVRSGVSIVAIRSLGESSPGPTGPTGTALFRAQLVALCERSRVITLDEAVRGLSREDLSVADSVVLTFDDAGEDFADLILPVLVAQHVPATVYVATRAVEERTVSRSGHRAASWSSLADALTTGLVTVGSRSHGPLGGRAPDTFATEDIRRSVGLIGDHLGRPPHHFSHPVGFVAGRATAAFVATQFRSAALIRARLNAVGRTDLHRLSREPMPLGDADARAATRSTTLHSRR